MDATRRRRRRRELRSERLGRPFDGADERTDVARTGMRLAEYLQRTASDATQCTWCGVEVAPAGADWKDHAVLRRLPVEKTGPKRTASGEFFLIEAFCPGCATLLDAELAAGDDAHARPRPELARGRCLVEYVVGIDIGGTCTDCVVVDGDGDVTLGKAFSTPPDFSGGILDALGIAAAAARHRRRDELLASTRLFLHSNDGGRERRRRRDARARPA